MLRKIALACATALVVAFAAADVQAFPMASPLAQTGAPEVTLVAGGCGPGWHRGPGGRCLPNRGPVVVAPVIVPRPVIVAPRVCPRGFHLSPRGVCVRNW